jgi:prolyl-tRNA editing enzyme YbaK/EbsC (Cys-tRNA(Pro) deacylase)
MTAVLDSIRKWLTESNVSFREVHHAPTRTSEESAVARGEPLEIGGKALLVKLGAEFALFVIPADRRMSSAGVRGELGVRKLRFANTVELQDLTSLVPGSVPPFGRPILPFDLYVDAGIRENDKIAFNAGSLTDSVIMSTDDYFRLAQPVKVFSFTQ